MLSDTNSKVCIRFSALLCCLLIFSCCSLNKKVGKPTNVAWSNGTWQGMVHQFNTNEDWDMELEVVNQTFNVKYPMSKCGASWSVLRATKNRIDLREKITHGIQNCVTRGMVVLERKDTLLLFKYFYPTDAILNAEGQLFKVQ